MPHQITQSFKPAIAAWIGTDLPNLLPVLPEPLLPLLTFPSGVIRKKTQVHEHVVTPGSEKGLVTRAQF